MSNDTKPMMEAEQPRLGKAATLARFALIGAALAAVAGSFAYLGGWFTPNELTPARFVDGFEHVHGVHPGFRRNHAKGLGVTGFFESSGKGVRLSNAVVFQPGRVPVIGRFSLGGGQPHAAETPDAVRGLGLEFSLPNGELWRTAMVNIPVFPFRIPEAFYEQMIASKPDPKTGKPDPAKMKAFIERYPETLLALSIIKIQTFSSWFADFRFLCLHAFRFVNAAGRSVPVRWLITPLQPFEKADTESAPRDKNYLFDGLIERIRLQPLRWQFIVIVGQPGDPTHDASPSPDPGRAGTSGCAGTLTFLIERKVTRMKVPRRISTSTR